MATWTRKPKIMKACPICGTEFLIHASHADRKTTCSRVCAGRVLAQKYEAGRQHLTCEACGKPFQAVQSRTDARFCSRTCANPAISRLTAAKRGDRLRHSGQGKSYVKMDGRHLHRTIAETILGRDLLPGEVVHHVDGNRLNNVPGNLQILPSQGEHARIHFTKSN